MSWLYSQALVAAYSEESCLDGKQYAQSNVNPIPQAFLSPDKMTEYSRLSRYGMTFAPLMESLGKELLMWFLADSRVKTFPLQERERELREAVLGFGEKWLESSVRFSLDTCSWKTAHCLWEEDLPLSSVILPKWGLMLNGELYQHKTLERPINATGYGLWPTPTVNGNYNKKGASKNSGTGLATAVKMWPTPNASPISNDLTMQKSGDGRIRPNKLGWEVAQSMWPTPTASMSKGSSPATLTRKSGRSRVNDRLDHKVMATDGGQLNPEWVEWLMGWPVGWTDLKPLEMDRYREWWQQHSIYSGCDEA